MLSRLAPLAILACVSALPTPGLGQTAGAQTAIASAPPAGASKAVCASTNGSDVSTSGSTNKPDCTPPVAPGVQTGTNTDTGKAPGDPGAGR